MYVVLGGFLAEILLRIVALLHHMCMRDLKHYHPLLAPLEKLF